MRLEGFLLDQDVNTIKLGKGNIKLEYDSPNAGEQTIHIDPRYSETFFSLEGVRSENYALDQASLPRIKSVILRRPINVEFYSVAKEYDGNDTFDKKYLRYRFTKTGASESGLVVGTDCQAPYLDITPTIVEPAEGYREGDCFIIAGSEPLQQAESTGYDDSKCPKLTLAGDWTLYYEPDYLFRTSFPVTRDENDSNVFTFYAMDFDFPRMDINVEGTHASDDKESNYPPYNMIYSRRCSDEDFNDSRRWLEVQFTQTLKLPTEELSTFENPVGNRFTRSDVGRVLVEVDNAKLPSKNVTKGLVPLALSNIKLKGEASNNYELNQVVSYGRVYPRQCSVKVRAEGKIYDGTTVLSYELCNGNEGISRLIDGDSVALNNDVCIACWSSKNVGATPECYRKPVLTGPDANNYYVEGLAEIVADEEVVISPRDVTATLDELRIVRNGGRYLVTYNLHNTISGDDVWLDFKYAAITITQDGVNKYLPNLFLNNTHVNFDKLQWGESENSLIVTNPNVPDFEEVEITDLENVTISGLILRGQDSNNYNLTNSEVSNVPIRIINLY